jgi:hypothetical protein
MSNPLELIKSPPENGTNSFCNDISITHSQYNTVEYTSNITYIIPAKPHKQLKIV